MKSINLIKPYIAEKRFNLLIGFVCLIATDLFQLFFPRVIKWTIDDITAYRIDLAGLSVYTLYMVGIAVMIGLFRYGWLVCFIGMARRVEEGLRNRLFEHLQTLSASYFDKTKTGDLMAHATNDMQQIRMATGIGIVTIIDTIFLGTAAIIFMAYINVRLTMFALIPMPFIILTSWFFSRKMHRMYSEVQGTFSTLTEAVRERFAGIRIIKAYTAESRAVAGVSVISEDYVDKNLKLVRITGSYSPMIAFLSSLTFAIVLYIGGRQTILTTITPGDFVAFSTYLGLLIWPMTAIGSVTNLIQRGKASLDRINAILETRPAVHDIPNAKPVRTLRKGIVFENVTFSYEKDIQKDDSDSRFSAISGIDIRLDQGMTLGIIGPPGSGKTTLLSLLPRFYDVSGGRILADGTDIRSLKLRDLRAMISFMPQEPFLFAGTIRENITFGKIRPESPEQEDPELIKAVEAAAMYDTIKSFPDGFETIVGEKGVILSGGQKQRIALARALMRKTPFLILDDPISQVDTETASIIINTVRSLSRLRTVMIVSHRVSAVQFADQIITLKNGRISESGTHDQLMRHGSYYAKMFSMQNEAAGLPQFRFSKCNLR
ncbi:MAG: ABC transporter ATP-binding protein [Deltaproteobacteria bacterium]|nr:MAG: ABC transporter ATP-binding protein [Deltaproteobacteria bacterium]